MHKTGLRSAGHLNPMWIVANLSNLRIMLRPFQRQLGPQATGKACQAGTCVIHSNATRTSTIATPNNYGSTFFLRNLFKHSPTGHPPPFQTVFFQQQQQQPMTNPPPRRPTVLEIFSPSALASGKRQRSMVAIEGSQATWELAAWWLLGGWKLEWAPCGGTGFVFFSMFWFAKRNDWNRKLLLSLLV